VYSLVSMNTRALRPSPPTQRARGQLRDGFRYVARAPRLWVPLLMMGIVGTLAYEFQVTLPVIAKTTFGGNAATYGFLTAAMGVGAVCGGLVTATRGRTGLWPLTLAGGSFGIAILCAAFSPVIAVAFVAMAAVGWTSVTFLATGNTTLQLESDASMRGRVMALWAVAFMGSTPIGGPLIGWIVAIAGARIGLAVGGLSALVAAAIGLLAMVRLGMLGRGGRIRVADPDLEGAIASTEPVAAGTEVPSLAL
jgi:MFS family permease